MWRVARDEHRHRTEIIELQKVRLRRLLEHVLTHSRFYRDYYGSQGITAGKLDGIELRHLPPINKQIAMEHFDAMVCSPAITRTGVERFFSHCATPHVRYRDRYYVMHTSGSTGTPGLFVYGPKDWRIMQALVGTRILRYRPGVRRIRYASLVKTDGHYAGIQLAQSAPGIAFKCLVLSIDDPTDQILERLQRFRPDLLGGYSSGLRLLAEQQLQGRLHIHPRRIVASAEPLDRAGHALVESAFGIRPVNLYAASESLALGASCAHSDGIHLFDDWHCFEVNDTPITQSPEPGFGPLRLTNLYNYTQPLIRYELTDEIELADEPCPCGWPFTLVKEIAGRAEEVLWFKRANGSREHVHPAALIGINVPGLQKLQAIQTGPQEMLLRLKTSGDPDRVTLEVKRQLSIALSPKHLDREITLRTQIVEEIQNDPSTGKYRFVVPYRPSTTST